MHKIIMPRFGETMTEGLIVKWLLKEGQQIQKGDPLFEVETDKVTLTVESQVDGILTKINVKENTTVPVGEVVGIIDDGQDSDIKNNIEFNEASPCSQKVDKPISQNDTKEEKKTNIENKANNIGKLFANEKRVKVSPAAKKLAKENNLNLFLVKSELKKDLILAEDVKRYLNRKNKLPELSDRKVSEGSIYTERISENIFEGKRKLTVERMVKSYREAPHVTLTTKVDMTEVVLLKTSISKKSLQRATYTDFIILVAARVLRENFIFNSYLIDNKIIKHENINIGIAIDVDNDLIVPVIKNVEKLRLLEIAEKREDLIKRAKNKKIVIDDLNDGTFTVTNLGKHSVEIFTPIINPPQTAILGVGQIKEEPIVYEGEIKIRSMAWLSLSFDHRIVDGASAAKFLNRIKVLLESIEFLL